MSEWIGQLQHPDSRRRKAGIAALAKSKQTAALGNLEQVSRHDPDEQIREYAAQAIRYIQKYTTFNPSANAEPAFLQNAAFQDAPVPAPHPAIPGARQPNWWIADLSFHIVVNVLGCLLFTLLILPNSASALLNINANVDSYDYRFHPELRLALAIQNAHLGELVVVGILIGIFSVFSTFLVFRLIHQVATRMFSGANTFPGMLHDTLMPYIIMSAVMYVLFFMASWINPLVIFSTGTSPLAFLVTLILTVVYGAAYVLLGKLIGKAYAFGTQKGCLSMVIAFALCIGGSFLLGALFGMH
jgi:hypothetical protein